MGPWRRPEIAGHLVPVRCQCRAVEQGQLRTRVAGSQVHEEHVPAQGLHQRRQVRLRGLPAVRTRRHPQHPAVPTPQHHTAQLLQLHRTTLRREQCPVTLPGQRLRRYRLQSQDPLRYRQRMRRVRRQELVQSSSLLNVSKGRCQYLHQRHAERRPRLEPHLLVVGVDHRAHPGPRQLAWVPCLLTQRLQRLQARYPGGTLQPAARPRRRPPRRDGSRLDALEALGEQRRGRGEDVRAVQWRQDGTAEGGLRPQRVRQALGEHGVHPALGGQEQHHLLGPRRDP